MVRILIVDDRKPIRRAFRLLIEQADDIQIVGEGSDGLEAVELAEKLKPDVILMDVKMPHLDGLKATQRISERGDHPSVLIVAMTWDKPFICRAIQNGARGYLAKSEVFQELVPAIRALYRGETYFSGSVAEIMADENNGECRD